MRRYLLLVILCGLLLGATAVSPPLSAAPPANPTIPVPVTRLPADPLRDVPRSLDAAADTCTNATNLAALPGGDISTVNFMTESPSDPLLSCTWGTPPAPRGDQGYRTVWYRFTAPYSGHVTVSTEFSTYDTILAVYNGTCSALAMLACNDDSNGLISEVALNVQKGVTYYIEVADWQSGTAGQAELSLTVLIDPIDTRWVDTTLMDVPRSRHALTAVGPDLYVLGGVSEMGSPFVLSNKFQRYETDTGNWVDLQPIPGTGYANTTAVSINGRIHVPSGFDGNVNLFNDTHWAYDLASGSWSTYATAPWPGGSPVAYGTAVVSQSPATPVGFFYVGGTTSVPRFDPPFPGTAPVTSDDVLFYRVSDDSWLQTYPALNTGRYAHTAAWVQDRLCVVGGLDSSSALLTGGECYKPGTGAWTPIGNMKYPRYNAGSAVGPDGLWYVFGGVDGNGNAVETVEVYNLQTNTWTPLDASYNLGDFANTLPREWPRGAFIGNTLWLVGGNSIVNNIKIPLAPVLKLPIILPWLYLPVINTTTGPPAPPRPENDTFATAYPLARNQARLDRFTYLLDLFDSYYFDLPTAREVTIHLSQIPIGSNYDLAVYNSNKLLWAVGDNPGTVDEIVTLALPAGRHYVFVERIFPVGPPVGADYRIIVQD
ncbi:MAG: hypothetical protein KC425_23320 [Anaerolineales bacterium]|nr:hypothetical protein [Anaerolineales bacterium]